MPFKKSLITVNRRTHNRPISHLRWQLLALPILLLAAFGAVGCGGGSSSAKRSKALIRERAVASARLTRGVFAIAGIGRKITRVPRPERPRLRWALVSVRHTRDAGAPNLDPDLGLYFVSQTDLDGSGHEDLFADASHNVPAGAFVWQAPTWTNGMKDSYPATIHTNYQIDGGQFAGERGTIDFTADDSTGDNGKMHIVMTTRINERVVADFDIVNGVVKGREQCTLPDDTTWIEFDTPQDDGGWLTTIRFDDGSSETLDTAPDGSIVEKLYGPDGSVDASGSLNSNGLDNITFNDGSQETIDVDLGNDTSSDNSDGSGSNHRTAQSLKRRPR